MQSCKKCFSFLSESNFFPIKVDFFQKGLSVQESKQKVTKKLLKFSMLEPAQLDARVTGDQEVAYSILSGPAIFFCGNSS